MYITFYLFFFLQQNYQKIGFPIAEKPHTFTEHKVPESGESSKESNEFPEC